MTVYINNNIIKELYNRAEKALLLVDNEIAKQSINNVLAMIDYINVMHIKQKKKIRERVNNKRKENKNYGRSKRICRNSSDVMDANKERCRNAL